MEGKASTQGFDPSSFVALVSGLAAQAKIFMGVMENPITRKKESVDLDRARILIGTVEMLHRKSAGNLSEEEIRFLQAVLTDLRLRFVEVNSQRAT